MTTVQTSSLELSRVNKENLAFLVPVLALPHAGEDAKKGRQMSRVIPVPCFCPVTVRETQSN